MGFDNNLAIPDQTTAIEKAVAIEKCPEVNFDVYALFLSGWSILNAYDTIVKGGVAKGSNILTLWCASGEADDLSAKYTSQTVPGKRAGVYSKNGVIVRNLRAPDMWAKWLLDYQSFTLDESVYRRSQNMFEPSAYCFLSCLLHISFACWAS